jgi:hypothetical protein
MGAKLLPVLNCYLKLKAEVPRFFEELLTQSRPTIAAYYEFEDSDPEDWFCWEKAMNIKRFQSLRSGHGEGIDFVYDVSYPSFVRLLSHYSSSH